MSSYTVRALSMEQRHDKTSLCIQQSLIRIFLTFSFHSRMHRDVIMKTEISNAC